MSTFKLYMPSDSFACHSVLPNKPPPRVQGKLYGCVRVVVIQPILSEGEKAIVLRIPVPKGQNPIRSVLVYCFHYYYCRNCNWGLRIQLWKSHITHTQSLNPVCLQKVSWTMVCIFVWWFFCWLAYTDNQTVKLWLINWLNIFSTTTGYVPTSQRKWEAHQEYWDCFLRAVMFSP